MEYLDAQGLDLPVVGFGTARMESKAKHREIITDALDAGYRHFDTAQRYGSESVLGDTIRDSDVDREEVFITTKLDDPNRSREAVIESTKESLDKLNTEYVDMLQNHWPNPENRAPDQETIDAMNELYDDGLVRNIGVANHSIEMLQNVLEYSDAPIVANQELYNFLDRERAQGERGDVDGDLRKFCIEADMILTAYSPLQVGGVVDEPKVVEIAERHEKTGAQVALRWLIQQPMVSVIPSSSSQNHIQENIDIFDFELSDEEMRELFEAEESLDDDLAAVFGLS